MCSGCEIDREDRGLRDHDAVLARGCPDMAVTLAAAAIGSLPASVLDPPGVTSLESRAVLIYLAPPAGRGNAGRAA
jgi:hypothetical protein